MASLNPLAAEFHPNPTDEAQEEEEEEEESRTFHQFSLLHEDVQVFVLTFVAHVPFDGSSVSTSLLTHVLPYVSHHFHAMSKSNVLWRQALERLVRNDAPLWTTGLRKLYADADENDEDIVKNCHEALNEPGYYQMFQMIVERHLRFTGPVFIMSGVVQLGEGLALHFFEPRYQLLIQRVLEGYPREAKEGNPISANEQGEYPTFVYSHVAPFTPLTPACLVRVQQCTVHSNGSADVLLIPTAYVKMERLWEDVGTGRLYYAQCLRMSGEEERQMEENRQIPAPMGFENSLIEMLLQDRGLMNGPAGIQRPLRDMLNYLIHEHGDNDEDDDDEDSAGMPAD
jgi:hypothetical protein